MWAATIVSIYRRQVILRGKVEYTSGLVRHLQVLMTIYSIICAIPSVFFIVVLIISTFKGVKLELGSWFIAFTAIIFFGNLANDFAPWRARIILADRGIIYPLFATGGWYWSRISNFEWIEASDKKSFQLTIEVKYFGFLNKAISLGALFDSETKQYVDNLIKEKIGRQYENRGALPRNKGTRNEGRH